MEPFRDAHRNCPACNATLRAFRDRLVCDTCGGVMLSLDDLKGAVAELTGLEPTITYRKEAQGKRLCPHCQTAMTTAKLVLELEGAKPVKPDPELDCCGAHGLWFDESELAIVLEPVAGKGFGGGRASPASKLDGKSGSEPRSFNFKIGGRGWGF
jgi:Zn-finger nucleic acid-binding protein